jgi:hypothetical protein
MFMYVNINTSIIIYNPLPRKVIVHRHSLEHCSFPLILIYDLYEFIYIYIYIYIHINRYVYNHAYYHVHIYIYIYIYSNMNVFTGTFLNTIFPH